MEPVSTGIAVVTAFRLSPTLGKLFERMLGPVADEVGKSLLNKLFLERRQRLAERAAGALAEANIEPVEVAPRLLLPIFDHAALEDNAELSEKWAALLANAANGAAPGRIRPIYIQTLSNLAPLDAMILDTIFDVTLRRDPHNTGRVVPIHEGELVRDPNISTEEIEESINTLIACGLIERALPADPDKNAFTLDRKVYIAAMGRPKPRERSHEIYITALGERFVIACRMPTAHESDRWSPIPTDEEPTT